MIPVEYFILRQRTRPSVEEGHLFIAECSLRTEEGVRGLINSHEKQRGISRPIRLANLNNESDDIDEQFTAFIKSEGGNRYLVEHTRYKMDIFKFTSGSPPEETRLSIVYAMDSHELSQHFPEVEEFIKRGNRWEELQRWGDALVCYYVGLTLFPDHPCLLLRLGMVQMRYTSYLTHAIMNLKKAVELLPSDGSALAQLGHCYHLLANTSEFELDGVQRTDLKHIALGLLVRAEVILPNDVKIQGEIHSLRNELGINSKVKNQGGFFS